MCSAYNRKPLRGGAQQQQQLASRCGAAVGVLNGTRAQANIWSDSGSFYGRLFQREIRADHPPPRKIRRFRSGPSVSAGNGSMKAKNHEKIVSQRASSIGRAWAKSLFTACGHTGFKCNILFENFPSTRAARWWASAALT